MQQLADLVASHEQWLIDRVLSYAKDRGYTRYASTLAEAWHLAIEGLSASLVNALSTYPEPPELSPDDDYTADPIASFGILEAQRHRSRGVTLGMFLGLMKYFRQSYIDLVLQGGFSPEEETRSRSFVDRFFDRLEVGFCVEWAALNEGTRTTELQQANRAIAEEKSKYLMLFESLQEPAVLLTPEGRIENFNNAAAILFEGLSTPGAGYYTAGPAAGPLSWLTDDLLVLAVAGAGESAIEQELNTRQGPRRFRIKAKRLLGVSERFGGTLLLLTDISEYEDAQARLRYRGEMTRLLSEVSAEFVGSPGHATDEIIEEALRRVGQFTGADCAFAFEFSNDGGTCSILYLWQSAPVHIDRSRLQDVDVNELPWLMEQLRRGDTVAVGSLHDLPPGADAERLLFEGSGIRSVFIVPLVFQGDVVGFAGLASATPEMPWSDDESYLLSTLGQVVTSALRRQHAERALAQEQHLLRTLIDNLPDYIYVKDAASRFILNNEAHLRLLKAQTQDDVLGKTDMDVFPSSLAARYFADEQAILGSGEPLLNREETVVDERGRKQWLLTTKVPLHDREGRPTGIVGMSRNITERKRMEGALAEHARLLEQANEDLQRRNQDLDEFTYVASHDLQEPLRKLSAFSDLLREDLANGDREAVSTDLKVITSGAQRMQHLVQDLLALSRSGRQKMDLQPIPLDRCVDRALDALEIRIKESEAEIIRHKLPSVRGDLSLLTQLYQNLIGNALKFHAEEKPRVELTAEKGPDGWILGVQDNGIGFKPQYAEQIFAPFKRLHRRGEYEGTGIGLAICRKIVERHGGKIWVESEPGKGAFFRFTLT